MTARRWQLFKAGFDDWWPVYVPAVVLGAAAGMIRLGTKGALFGLTAYVCGDRRYFRRWRSRRRRLAHERRQLRS